MHMYTLILELSYSINVALCLKRCSALYFMPRHIQWPDPCALLALKVSTCEV